VKKEEFEKKWNRIKYKVKSIYIKSYDANDNIIYANSYKYVTCCSDDLVIEAILFYMNDYLIAKIHLKDIKVVS